MPPSIRLPILALVLILKHAEVRVVAALRYIVFLKSFEDGASRLVRVRAITEAAVF